MIDYYNPNIYSGVHTVRITLMEWDYVGHIAYKIGGNTRGASLLDADFFDYADEDDLENLTENDCGLEWLEDSATYQLVLTNPAGEQIQEEWEADELKNMVVSIEFVRHGREEQ